MEVVIFPRIAGVQWSDTVESTLWGMALGVAAVVDIAGVLPVLAGGVVVAVGGTVFRMWRGGVRWAP